MRQTQWQDLAIKLAPLVVSVITAYYSYRLNRAKSDRENARDQYNRLNAECEKVTSERDEYYEEIKRLNQEIKRLNEEILKLNKELLLRDSEKQQREAEHDK